MPRAAPLSPLLAGIEPMLFQEVRRPFDEPGWTAEVKYDGYRILALVQNGAVQLKTRNGTNATTWYPEFQSLAALKGQPLVLDDIGRSDFNRLQDRSKRRGKPAGSDDVVFCAFDLLMSAGKDIRALPLKKRKAKLERLLASKPASTLYVADLPGQVPWLFAQALALQLEGIVAKRLDSPYLSGERSNAWLKVKRPGAVPPERFHR
jgi:bifunctional non-homologous end joining protein LigD